MELQNSPENWTSGSLKKSTLIFVQYRNNADPFLVLLSSSLVNYSGKLFFMKFLSNNDAKKDSK